MLDLLDWVFHPLHAAYETVGTWALVLTVMAVIAVVRFIASIFRD